MFLRLADLDADGMEDVAAAVKPREILFLRRRSRDGRSWETRSIPFPENTGRAKAVGVGDLDGDGRPDLALTCEDAMDGRSGVMGLLRRPGSPPWEAREISGTDGVKYDLIELLDLDGDGDRDALTCEETRNLGVFWYENPGPGAAGSPGAPAPFPRAGP